MADKKKSQDDAFHKEQKSDFKKDRDEGFVKGGNADFKPRDGNAEKKTARQSSKAESSYKNASSNVNEFTEKAFSDDENSEIQAFGFSSVSGNVGTSKKGNLSKTYARQKQQEILGQDEKKPDTELEKESSEVSETKKAPEENASKKQGETLGENKKKPDAESEKENSRDSKAEKTSKKYAKQRYRKTFRQNERKSNAKAGEENSRAFKVDKALKDDSWQKYDETFGQNVQKLGEEAERKNSRTSKSEKASKKYAKQKYLKTFGQNVQKLGVEADKEKSEFLNDKDVFTEQFFSQQSEETKEKQDFTDDYHRRDTYRQSQKKGKYHKKRVKKEHHGSDTDYGQFQTKENVFEDTGRADFKETDDADFMGSKKLQKKQKQAEKAGKKTERAREKLPKKREYTLQRVYDEKTGTGKYTVVPVESVKNFKEEGIGRTTMRRLQNEGKNFVHSKVAETEKENSAVEGAHKTEQRAEDLYGFVKRHYKGKDQRQRTKVAKLEKKQFKKEVNFQYQKFLEENPQMQKKALQKRLQKQRIKREYIKARQKSSATKSAHKAVKKSANATTVLARKLMKLASRNISVLVSAGLMLVLLIIVMSAISSCGAMFASMQSTLLTGSYLSEPSEIDAADLEFTRLELDLQNRIDRIETDYPGYDEYSYNLGEIGHNPFTLISYLSAVYSEFTASEVESEIQALFNEMYTLTLTPDTETRTRHVSYTDASGHVIVVTQSYEVSILRVVLTVKPLEVIVTEKMDADQTEVYDIYAETCGLLQIFASPLDLYWYNYVSSYYGYRKNPNTGADELHRGLDIAVPTGTTVYAAHDGMVTTATYDSYYGNYVVIEKDGYATKYAHMESLNVSAGQTITEGTAIGTTGNTGSSMGSHLHIECLYNGEYYNPLFYFEVGTVTLYGGNVVVGNEVPPDSYDDASVQALMEEAEKYLGYPYVWGGSDPSTGFDCSGFVCWIFTNSGVHNLPRTTAQGIYDQCTPVSAEDAKAGDIIFFTGTYDSEGAVSHVGIYCGNRVMVHCGDPISYADINSPYWQSHFYSFGRLN